MYTFECPLGGKFEPISVKPLVRVLGVPNESAGTQHHLQACEDISLFHATGRPKGRYTAVSEFHLSHFRGVHDINFLIHIFDIA